MRAVSRSLGGRLGFGGLVGAIVLVLSAANATASPITYQAILSGAAESPPNGSLGTGLALVTIDTDAHTLSVDVTFSGLSGTTTASHIHCCTLTPFTGTAGVATVTPTFTNFPLGVTSGTYSRVFDTLAGTATWNTPFITASGGTSAGAEAALAAGLFAGEAYLNIHTTVVPGGEIRGFLTPVPEPSSLLLLGTGGLGLFRTIRRRRTVSRS